MESCLAKGSISCKRYSLSNRAGRFLVESKPKLLWLPPNWIIAYKVVLGKLEFFCTLMRFTSQKRHLYSYYFSIGKQVRGNQGGLNRQMRWRQHVRAQIFCNSRLQFVEFYCLIYLTYIFVSVNTCTWFLLFIVNHIPLTYTTMGRFLLCIIIFVQIWKSLHSFIFSLCVVLFSLVVIR